LSYATIPCVGKKNLHAFVWSPHEGIIFKVLTTDGLIWVRNANPDNYSWAQVLHIIRGIIPRGILVRMSQSREKTGHRAIKTFFMNYVGSATRAVVKIAVAPRHWNWSTIINKGNYKGPRGSKRNDASFILFAQETQSYMAYHNFTSKNDCFICFT